MVIQDSDVLPVLYMVPLLPNWYSHFCLVPDSAVFLSIPKLGTVLPLELAFFNCRFPKCFSPNAYPLKTA